MLSHHTKRSNIYTIFTEFVVALVDHSGQLLTIAWIHGPVDDDLSIIDVDPESMLDNYVSK